MSIIDYTRKIKKIYDALGSISVTMDEDEMVPIYLDGLAQKYGPIWMSICTRERILVLFSLAFDASCRGEPHGCVDEHAHQQQDVVHGGREALVVVVDMMDRNLMEEVDKS